MGCACVCFGLHVHVHVNLLLRLFIPQTVSSSLPLPLFPPFLPPPSLSPYFPPLPILFYPGLCTCCWEADPGCEMAREMCPTILPDINWDKTGPHWNTPTIQVRLGSCVYWNCNESSIILFVHVTCLYAGNYWDSSFLIPTNRQNLQKELTQSSLVKTSHTCGCVTGK